MAELDIAACGKRFSYLACCMINEHECFFRIYFSQNASIVGNWELDEMKRLAHQMES
jgi:hypothetical protein